MTVLVTTELEAVNEMLAAISEAPVTTLASDTIDDAQIALNTLRNVSREIQTEGWHFNTDYDYPIETDSDNKMPYPLTAAHVDPQDVAKYDLVRRGDFLYDRKNRTFVFDASVDSIKCKVTWLLDFEDLPQAFRIWITMRAANRFVQQQLGDPNASAYSRSELETAQAGAKGDDLRRSDANMLTGSYSTHRVIARRSGYYWR